MNAKLCLLCCQGFHAELEQAVSAEGWSDVAVAAFPTRCGQPPLDWNELRPLLAADCGQVLILGRACVKGLAEPPAGWPPVRLVPLDECFHLIAGATQVSEAIERGAYLVTPAWLADWRGNLRKLGFAEDTAADFFHDFARELLLLDTGGMPDATLKLAELAAATGLPANRVPVGIDHTRLLLARLVAEWRLETARLRAENRAEAHARELADHVSAMDFLGRLALLKNEEESIAAIEELFRMLFAPRELHFVRFEGGAPQGLDALSPGLATQLKALLRDWAWTESGTGFLLRITRCGETLGGLVAEGFAFPEYRQHYLSLALSVAGVCGLALENARTFQRIKAVEQALRVNEQNLRLAQAIAHVGHWEWHVGTETMRWSDETYRILGYAPTTLTPTRDSFFQVIHPEDRARVAEKINHASAPDGFDIEYRIILPDGNVRIVHGVGKVIFSGADQAPNIFGILRDVRPNPQMEMLGVIQDITERKALESRLEEEAHTDALTGCANRRRFLELANDEWARVRRYGGELSLLMLDLDHFKAVNDRHGHGVGDLALRTLVRVCHAGLRREDVIGRIGGEEFAILLPETPADRALEAAERLRRAVAAAEVPLEGTPPLRFTTSIGVATLAASDADLDRFMGRADQALYLAKHTGRNRVVAAESER